MHPSSRVCGCVQRPAAIFALQSRSLLRRLLSRLRDQPWNSVIRVVLRPHASGGITSQLGTGLILDYVGRVTDEAGYKPVEQQHTAQLHSSISLCRAAVCGIAGVFNGDWLARRITPPTFRRFKSRPRKIARHRNRPPRPRRRRQGGAPHAPASRRSRAPKLPRLPTTVTARTTTLPARRCSRCPDWEKPAPNLPIFPQASRSFHGRS